LNYNSYLISTIIKSSIVDIYLFNNFSYGYNVFDEGDDLDAFIESDVKIQIKLLQRMKFSKFYSKFYIDEDRDEKVDEEYYYIKDIAPIIANFNDKTCVICHEQTKLKSVCECEPYLCLECQSNVLACPICKNEFQRFNQNITIFKRSDLSTILDLSDIGDDNEENNEYLSGLVIGGSTDTDITNEILENVIS
jgi:hypothetical protein